MYVTPSSKYQFSERHGKQCHAQGLETELAAVEHHAKDVEVGIAGIETPDKTKSPWGWFTVLDQLTTNVLVGIWYHAPVISSSLTLMSHS